MARTGSGSTGTLWASVILGIAFVVCLVLSIVFYTRIEAAEQIAGKSMAQLERFANANERSGNDVIREMSQDPAKSVVGHLLADNAQLKQIIIGSSETNVAAILQDMEGINIRDGQTLMREIRRLRAEEDSAKELEGELTKKYEAANRRASEAETAKNRVESDYRASVKQLESQLKKINRDYQTFRTKADRDKKSLASQLKRIRNQAKQNTADQASLVGQKNSEIDGLKKRIARLESQHDSRISQGAKVDPSTLVDGKIASILVEQNAVYIDLGRTNRMIPGITFEIYDPRTGIVKNAEGKYRGKATIEIINVFESTSVARVVRRSRGQEVFPGDLIANLVYDPDLKFKFYVFGEFDVDSIGHPSQTDRRRVENMIVRWGGLLIADDPQSKRSGLTYDVDFLVLGEEPLFPQAPDENEVDPTAIEQHTRELKRYEAYQGLIKEARELSIPILNQNRFLSMVGYYRR